MTLSTPRFALCLEQTLGHRSHGLNLQAALTSRDAVDVFAVEPPARQHVRLPWTLQASWQAREQLRASAVRYRSTLFHTQSVSLFARSAVRGGNYVVSVDATPIQFDALGRWYGHRTQGSAVEAWKRKQYSGVFGGARGLVAWSQWAVESLVADYCVERDSVLVAHPGAGDAFFAIERGAGQRKPVILFVGGDFERKGGPALLRAWREIAQEADLIVVGDAPLADEPGLRVERNVRPGSEQLHALYRDADVFCLPTLGDCTPVVIGEAMAAGLPVVTTDVGSNSESVMEAETGFVLPVGDGTALTEALRRLCSDPDLRVAMGRAGRERAHERMHAGRNARRILEFMQEVC
jgi:glycosyltransferase involved in cell wall biosynthesis